MSTVEGIRFEPDAYYSEYALLLMRRKNWNERTLARARREQGLRCSQVGNERLYKGEWLNDWLDRLATTPG